MKKKSHLVVSCNIDDQENKIRSHSLIDNKASEYAFIDRDFVRCHNLSLYKLKELCALKVIDERPIEFGDITYMIKICMIINKYVEKLSMIIIKLDYYFIVLEIP